MGFFKKNDGYQLSSVLCLRVLGLNKENLKMVFHAGSSPVLTTNMSRWWNWLDTKPQQEGWNAVTDSEVQGVEGEDYAWL